MTRAGAVLDGVDGVSQQGVVEELFPFIAK
jgi:hypothetical protein